MPTPLRYEEQPNFQPPTPRQRNQVTDEDESEFHEYEIRFTNVNYEYFTAVIEARSLDDAWNIYHNGYYDADCDDSEVMDTIDIEIEEI